MVVTTVDIPDELLQSIDDLVSKGKARNRREVILRALSYYKKYDIFEWSDSKLLFGGIRKAMISKRLADLLDNKFDDELLYQIGKELGPTMHDYFLLTRGIDSVQPVNYPVAFEHLNLCGWGEFSMNRDKIRINEPFMPKMLLKGYLESALRIKLEEIPTTENVVLFRVSSESRKNEARPVRKALAVQVR